MRWMCSMPTGHPSSHHPHVVHPHTAASVATSVIMSGPVYCGSSPPPLAAAFCARRNGALSRRCSRCSTTRCFGLSVLPVLKVGQLMVQRPHSRHEAISSSVFHPYCSTCETPKVSAFSKSLIGASRPRGFRLRKKRLVGANNKRRSLL